MKTGAKGARAERRAKKWLESKGYLVIKSGGSLGTFDLVALNNLSIRCIQVKTGAKPRPPTGKERDRLQAAFEYLPLNATIEVWLYRDGYPDEPEMVYYRRADRCPEENTS